MVKRSKRSIPLFDSLERRALLSAATVGCDPVQWGAAMAATGGYQGLGAASHSSAAGAQLATGQQGAFSPKPHHIRRPHTMHTMLELGPASQIAPASNAPAVTTVTVPPAGSMQPAQVRHAYGFDQVSFNAVAGDGTGQTIAIVDAYHDPNIANDLAKFDAQYSLPAPPSFTVLNQSGVAGSYPPSDASGGWELEEALDVEWAHAMAPKAKLILVEASSSSTANLIAAVDTAAARANVVSMSWGNGEFSAQASYESHFSKAGVAFVAASGDTGAPIGWPAASPSVLAVGGTSLTLNADNTRSSESAWSGSGGGVSAYASKPAYQPNAYSTATASQPLGARGNPDVAYDSDPKTGFAVYDSVADYPNYPQKTGGQSGWFRVGGTSAAAPQWAALLAIADQGRAAAGAPLLDTAAADATPSTTQVQTQLYASPLNLNDITTGGSNGAPAYSAGAGYDLATGLGTPQAAGVVNLFAKVPNAPATVSAAAASSSEIDLTWSPVASATGYVVQRSTDPAFAAGVTTVGSVATNQARFADTTLPPQPSTAVTYYYRVQAFNAIGTSAYPPLDTSTTPPTGSDYASATAPVYVAAPAPTNLAAAQAIVSATQPGSPTPVTHASTSQLLVSWTDNGDASTENGFVLRRSTSASFSTFSDTAVPLSASSNGVATYADSGLQPGVTYYYRVFATNSSGLSSAPPDAVNATGAAVTGAGPGLTGRYYGDTTFTTLKATRTDAQVNFNWGTSAPASGMPTTNYTVRWTGQVQAAVDETYTFYARTDDDMRLWISDESSPNSPQLLLSIWGRANTSEWKSVGVPMIAGHKYDIQMDYEQLSGGASASLYWSSPSTPIQVIPQAQLYSTYDAGAQPTSTYATTIPTSTDVGTWVQ